MDPTLLLLFLCIALGVALYARAIPQGGPGWWGWAGATVALVLASRLADASLARELADGLAELTAVGLVLSTDTTEARAAARQMLLAVALAVVLTFVSRRMIEAGAHDGVAGGIAVAALVLGFALRVGLVPVCFWLPSVARATPAMTTALIVAVVDVGGFCDLLALREIAPWVFAAHRGIWIAVAVISMLGGALLALAQTELKPMLAYSSIDDIGTLLLGLVLGGTDGTAAAWFGILSHGIAKVVLFGAVGAAEWHLGHPVTLATRGLAARLPLASAAFMIGALGFLGVPPGLGFIGHWRLYLAGAELGGPPLLAAMFAASAMALLCYVRAIHRTWLGPPEVADTGRALPTASGAVLVAFALALVLLGLVPDRLRLPDTATHALAALQRSAR